MAHKLLSPIPEEEIKEILMRGDCFGLGAAKNFNSVIIAIAATNTYVKSYADSSGICITLHLPRK